MDGRWRKGDILLGSVVGLGRLHALTWTVQLACGPGGGRKRVGEAVWPSVGVAQATHLSDLCGKSWKHYPAVYWTRRERGPGGLVKEAAVTRDGNRACSGGQGEGSRNEVELEMGVESSS